jgi:phosphocarrier protein HPr
MEVATAEVEICNLMGIHLRPASNLVQICNQFPACEVEFSKGGLTVNGKSIMSVIMLAAEKGSVIGIRVTGDECRELLDQLVALVKGKFGEEE